MAFVADARYTLVNHSITDTIMLTLRSEQITLFKRADVPYFEPRMLQHLQDALPHHWQVIGEDPIRQTVRQGIGNAARHGFTSREPVRFFLELTLLLGSAFPDDPQLPWVGLALDAERGSELDKARNLHDATLLYLEQVHGDNGESFDTACERLLEEKIDLATGSREKFESTVMVRLDHLWPEKYNQLGEDRIRDLIKAGLKASAKKGIKLENGAFLQICLMFLLGHRYDQDPLYPWAHTAGAEQEPAARVEQLHQAARKYLQRWCEQPSPAGVVLLPARPGASAVQGHPYEQPLQDPAVLAALNRAWQESQPDDPAQRRIEGGYITRQEDGTFLVERWPTGERGGITPLPLDKDGRYNGAEVLGEFRTQPHPMIDEKGQKWLQGFQLRDFQALAAEPYIGMSYLIGREKFWQLPAGKPDAESAVLGSREDVLNP